jgi:hypothetical protein
MSMTRRHYVALAEAFAAARADVQAKEPSAVIPDLLDGISYAAEHIADALARDNRAFDRERFLRAAGVQA